VRRSLRRPDDRGPVPADRWPPWWASSGAEVALVYFDASAFVKLLVEEPGTELAVALWDGCDAAVSSRLAYPEVRAALAGAHRNHDLDRDGLEQAEESWEEFWGATRPVELTPAVGHQAGQLARQLALRGADAVHLASALAMSDQSLIVAVWDRRLHDGALASHLAVAPVTLDPP
jgi:predicted nucleic acid-binding protein